MKKFKSLLLVCYILAFMTACSGGNEPQEEITTQGTTETIVEEASTENNENSSILVAYFSYGENTDLSNSVEASTSASINIMNNQAIGNTGLIANMIANSLGADTHSIKIAELYPADYDTTFDLAKEEQNNDFRPTLTSSIDNLDNYDTVFIGYPNWWGDMPMALYSFFDEYDFSGKTIVPFCTSEGSRFSDTIETIAELEPNSNVIEEGFHVSGSSAADAQEDVLNWLSEIGF